MRTKLSSGGQASITLKDREGATSHTFNNLHELCVSWLNELASTQKEKPIFIIDSMSLTDIGAKIDQNKALKIMTIRSNHYSAPTFDERSPMEEDHVNRINALDEIDHLVITTERQTNDIKNYFKINNKISTIFNSVQPYAIDTHEERDINQIIMVTRISEGKQVQHAIKAFSIALNQAPKAKLVIYGQGDETASCEELIDKLGLSNSVRIMGHKQRPEIARAYCKSLVSIVTSQCEGFGRVIIESMYYGTPVISYDINYGPRDIINDGVDGFLIPADDIDALANKLVWTLQNPDKVVSAGDLAREKATTAYSEENEMAKWLDLLSTLTDANKTKAAH